MEFLLIGLGAMFGAVSRYIIGQLITSEVFPLSTLVVNTIGSLLLGIATGLSLGTSYLIFGVGFCGSFTTFSSFSFQTVDLFSGGRQKLAVYNAGLNLALCVCAVYVGIFVSMYIQSLWQ
jgi:CrcB protein